MAFPVTLNGRTYTLADFEGTNYVDGFPDALEDFVTQAGDIYNDTSSTSETIGTGSKTFTVSSGKPYQEGTPLRIADAASPDENFLDCVVTSYSGTALTVNAFGFAGSGTFSSWTINIGGAKTVDGTLAVNQGGTGSTSASGARTNLDVYSKSEANSRFLDVSGEASDVTMNGNVTIGDAPTDTLQVNATATLEDATLVTADINDGTIDGTVIGGNSAAAGTFTTITGSSDMNIDSGTLFVDSTNNRVGVGTSSPTAPLQIDTNSGTSALFRGTGVSSGLSIDHATNLTTLATRGSDSLAFATDFSEAARIDSSGNVLVGTTTSPSDAGAIVANNGVYLGGTGSANKLDDYEEGTYGVTLIPETGSITLQTNNDSLAFEKIGNAVNVHGRVRVDSVSSPTGKLKINLPFVSSSFSDDAGRVSGVAYLQNAALAIRDYGTHPTISPTSFVELADISGSLFNLDVSDDFSGNELLFISLTYRAT